MECIEADLEEVICVAVQSDKGRESADAETYSRKVISSERAYSAKAFSLSLL